MRELINSKSICLYINQSENIAKIVLHAYGMSEEQIL